jgi:hypothetical protein
MIRMVIFRFPQVFTVNYSVYECTKRLIALFYKWTMHGLKAWQNRNYLHYTFDPLSASYNVSNHYRRLYNSLKDGSAVWFRVDERRGQVDISAHVGCWRVKETVSYNTYTWKVSCHFSERGYENHDNTKFLGFLRVKKCYWRTGVSFPWQPQMMTKDRKLYTSISRNQFLNSPRRNWIDSSRVINS